MLVTLAVFALAAADQIPPAQQESRSHVERVRAALETPPSTLTLPDVKPTFSVHIEERRPLQEIFDTASWQLPHVAWTPPPLRTRTAFGTIPIVSMDLLAIAGSMADAWRARGRHQAAADVPRAIADYCAAQLNAGQGILICDNLIR